MNSILNSVCCLLAIFICSCNAGSSDNTERQVKSMHHDWDETSNQSHELTVKNDIDICKCLTEAGNSEFMIQNGKVCDEAISKEIGVVDWRKVNMKYDKVTSKKFDDLVLKCTGKRPRRAEIAGVYSGTDNVGMESTIILRSGGTLIIQASVGDGTPDYGRWTGTADDLSLYHNDDFGNEQLIANAEISDEGLKIKGGRFYKRQ